MHSKLWLLRFFYAKVPKVLFTCLRLRSSLPLAQISLELFLTICPQSFILLAVQPNCVNYDCLQLASLNGPRFQLLLTNYDPLSVASNAGRRGRISGD